MSTTVACSVSDLTAAIHLEEDLLLSRPWPAVDLDPHGLPAVVGLGLGFELAQYQSNSVEPVQSLADPSAVLSKVPVMPGREGVASSAALAGLPQQADALLCQLGVHGFPAQVPQVLQLVAQLGHQPAQQPQSAAASLPNSRAAQRQSEEDAASESEVPTDGDGSTGSKAKALSSPEKKRKRRQEINRKSARRIRERRSQEVEDLKRQVAHLQKQLLLPYTAQITRDKDILVQRLLELTERSNQMLHENLELRRRLHELGRSLPPPAAPSCFPLPANCQLPAAPLQPPLEDQLQLQYLQPSHHQLQQQQLFAGQEPSTQQQLLLSTLSPPAPEAWLVQVWPATATHGQPQRTQSSKQEPASEQRQQQQ